jgi:hypothetical protein
MTSTVTCLVSRRVVDPALDHVHRLRDEATGIVYYVLSECLPAEATTETGATALKSTFYPVCRGDGNVRCVVRTVTGVAGRGSRRILLPGSRANGSSSSSGLLRSGLFWRN